MGKLIILTGAPESDRLDWTTPDLLETFLEPIARFARLPPQTKVTPPDPTTPPPPPQQQQGGDQSVLDLAVWRSLPLQRTHVPTGFSQQHDLQFIGKFPSSADFLTTAGISFGASSSSSSSSTSRGPGQEDDAEGEESSRLLAEFYDHSLAVHQDLASSQLVPPATSRGQRSGATETTSLVTDISAGTSSTPGSEEVTEDDSTTFISADGTVVVKTPLQPGARGLDHHLSDLEDVPPAAYLLSILPQTMTVTLIVGIISIAAPRTVETRYGTAKTLVEVMVGDETKSGFSVTFWLSDADGGGGGGVLAGLRNQDVVLMQNVALNVFRGKVYGGSLRKDLTRVYLLYRGRMIGSEDVGGYYSNSDLTKAGREGNPQHPQLEKTRRVRDWVLKFVGSGPSVDNDAGNRKTAGTRRSKRRPPPRRDWNQPPPLNSQ